MSTPETTSHRLGPVDAIPVGEGRGFAVGDEQIAVFRLRDRALRAMEAVCPHAGGPLADALVDDAKIVCPMHNHTFSFVDGSCLNGDFAVRVYPVREEGGEVVVDI
ncbi:MAG: Rieske (2Fe-2S) protein [Actinomycetota bacterium]|nr:Rieske (2Fe-2S) protein [Actinomycetota bacterium]